MNATDLEVARRLVTSCKMATLSTLAAREDSGPPYPFGSLVAVATDQRGAPLLLLSALAEHTKNLVACPRASLLYVDARAPEPLAGARVTLLGDIRRVRETEVESARTLYLARHPEAGPWSTFNDFAYYAMTVTEVRLVAGFGKMGWIDPQQLQDQARA